MSVLSTHLSSSHTFTKLPQRSITLLRGLGVKGDAHAGKKTQHEYYIKVDKRKGALRHNIRQVHLIQSELFDEEGFCGEDGQRLYPGQMGENITTVGVDLLALGKGTRLRFVEAVADQSKVSDTIIANGTFLSGLVRALVFAVIILAILGVSKDWRVAAVATVVGLLLYRFAYLDWESLGGKVAVVELSGRRRPCNKIDNNIRRGLKDKCIVKDENGKIVGHKAGVVGIVTGGGVVKPGMSIIVEPAEVFEELPVI